MKMCEILIYAKKTQILFKATTFYGTSLLGIQPEDNEKYFLRTNNLITSLLCTLQKVKYTKKYIFTIT